MNARSLILAGSDMLDSILPVVSMPPKPFRFTISQYRRLAITDLFHDLKTMLIDGELYVMPLPEPPHDVGITLTHNWLSREFDNGYWVRNQMGFDIGMDNDPGPDLAVVKGTFRDFSRATPTKAEFIVEIADSSLAIDTGRKAELYATAGVPDYWVLDVDNRQLHVFRDPQPGGTFALHQLLNDAESIAPLASPNANVTVRDLLPNPE